MDQFVFLWRNAEQKGDLNTSQGRRQRRTRGSSQTRRRRKLSRRRHRRRSQHTSPSLWPGIQRLFLQIFSHRSILILQFIIIIRLFVFQVLTIASSIACYSMYELKFVSDIKLAYIFKRLVFVWWGLQSEMKISKEIRGWIELY